MRARWVEVNGIFGEQCLFLAELQWNVSHLSVSPNTALISLVMMMDWMRGQNNSNGIQHCLHYISNADSRMLTGSSFFRLLCCLCVV